MNSLGSPVVSTWCFHCWVLGSTLVLEQDPMWLGNRGGNGDRLKAQGRTHMNRKMAIQAG